MPKAMIGGRSWAFDAVYTPVKTRFLLDAMDVQGWKS
jgi:shikimate 5-dehydrogenase